MTLDLFCKMYDTWKQEGKIIYENKAAYSTSQSPQKPQDTALSSQKHTSNDWMNCEEMTSNNSSKHSQKL